MAEHGYPGESRDDRGQDRDWSAGGRDRDEWMSGGSDWDRNPDDRSAERMSGSGHSAFSSSGRDYGGSSNSSPSQHDHYRSWRDRHMQALDRDYQDYCREREQQFHSDFDNWRQNRNQSQSPSSTGNARETTSKQKEMTGSTSG